MKPAEQTVNNNKLDQMVVTCRSRGSDGTIALQSTALVINPVGKRPRGRPRNRWEDDVPKWYKVMGIPKTDVKKKNLVKDIIYIRLLLLLFRYRQYIVILAEPYIGIAPGPIVYPLDADGRRVRLKYRLHSSEDRYKIEQGGGRSSVFTGSKDRACDRESR